MIGLGTNVLMRYIAQDDPKQSPPAAIEAGGKSFGNSNALFEQSGE